MKAVKPYLIRLAKFLLRLALDQAVAKALPQIYSKLDADMPTMLMNYGPRTISHHMQSVAMDTAGQRISETDLDAIVGLYSPIAAAARNFDR